MPAPSDAVLAAMCETADTEDNCAIYRRTAASGEKSYLSDTLFSALYGEAARGLLSGADGNSATINDAAICLSVSPTPLEFAVFRCSDMRGTATAAKLCRTRLEMVRGAWKDTAYAALTAEGVVTVEGSYVFLIIAPNPDRALRAARAAIRKGA